jgi:hypothetical protein
MEWNFSVMTSVALKPRNYSPTARLGRYIKAGELYKWGDLDTIRWVSFCTLHPKRFFISVTFSHIILTYWFWHFSTTNPTLLDVGLNPGRCRGNPATNCPKYSTTLGGRGQGIIPDIIAKFISRAEKNHEFQSSEHSLFSPSALST